MFDGLKKTIEKIKHLSDTLDKYQKDSIIQAMPSLAFVNRAKKAIEEGKFEEAEKILTKAKSLPQEDALVYKYFGIIICADDTQKHKPNPKPLLKYMELHK